MNKKEYFKPKFEIIIMKAEDNFTTDVVSDGIAYTTEFDYKGGLWE